MKIRDSGMPAETLWTTFFDSHAVLTKLGLVVQKGDGVHVAVVDFGCGYGTFAVAAAQLTDGIVYGIDIEPEMLAETQRKAAHLGLTNVRTLQCDFMHDGTGLAENSTDYAMLFNVLHTAHPVKLLREAYRVLAPGGTVAILHWNYDVTTPRGPSNWMKPPASTAPARCASTGRSSCPRPSRSWPR